MVQRPDDERQSLLGERNASSPKPGVSKSVLAVMILGTFLSLACESFVVSTHETIGSYFNHLSMSSWLMTAFNMGYCAMLPLFGNLSEMYGSKNNLLASYALFGIGCAITGLAISMPMAVMGRVFTGAGGAGMVDLVNIVLNYMAEPADVAVYRSYMSLGLLLGLSCGAPLGGFLTDTVGWRWSFLVMIPGVLLCFLAAGKKLPADTPETPETDSTGESKAGPSSWHRLDLWGFFSLLALTGSSLMMIQLTGEAKLYDRSLVLSILGAACGVSAISFLISAYFRQDNAIIPLALITENNGVGRIYLIQILLQFVEFGVATNVASFLLHTKNTSNSVAGITLLLFAVGSSSGALICGQLLSRFKRCKPLTTVCLLIQIISCALIVVRWRHLDPPWWDLSYIVFVALGMGGVLSVQFMDLSLRPSRISSNVVITTYYLAQQVGMITGVAFPTAAFKNLYKTQLATRLSGVPHADKIISRLLEDNRIIKQFPQSIQLKIRLSFLQSFQIIPILCLGCSVLMLPVVLSLDDVILP